MTRPPLPDEALRVSSASINSGLAQERNGDVTLGYGFEIEFHPFFRMEESDSDDEDADELLVEITCKLSFAAPLNRARNWKEIGGTYTYGPDENGAFIKLEGTGDSANPVDVDALQIQHLSGCNFRISADFNLLLEVWGSGYADRSLHLDFDATFKQMTIQMQNFTEDSGIRDLKSFLPKHVDMNCYQNVQVFFESLAIIDACSD